MAVREKNKDYDTLENIDDVIDFICHSCDDFCGWANCPTCELAKYLGFEKCNEIYEKSKGDIYKFVRSIERCRCKHSV